MRILYHIICVVKCASVFGLDLCHFTFIYVFLTSNVYFSNAFSLTMGFRANRCLSGDHI